MTLVRFGNSRTGFPALPGLMETLLGTELFDNLNFSGSGNSLPAVNVKETANDFIVEVAAPGMTKEDFKIKLENNVLSISSEKEERNVEKTDTNNYTRREFSYQSFQRSMVLPAGVEADKIKAAYKDGILSVSIPKKEEVKAKPSRMIEVL